MRKLSVNTHHWQSVVFSGATGEVGSTRGPDEPKDRLEETRAYTNELEERIAKLEDVVYILTGRKSSVPPAPTTGRETNSKPEVQSLVPRTELGRDVSKAYSSHNRGCAISWSLGTRTDCTCPGTKGRGFEGAGFRDAKGGCKFCGNPDCGNGCAT